MVLAQWTGTAPSPLLISEVFEKSALESAFKSLYWEIMIEKNTQLGHRGADGDSREDILVPIAGMLFPCSAQ